MATVTVGVSARASTVVAPNSPSEMAKANPAADEHRPAGQGEVDRRRQTPPRAGAEHAGRLPQPRVDGPQRGDDGADTNGTPRRAWASGHERGGAPQVEGRLVEARRGSRVRR